MAAGHGGTRPGAGRPQKAKTRSKPEGEQTATHYADALSYLEAVVRGDEPPDNLRIAAARIVLPFQKPKARAPVRSPTPTQLRAAGNKAVEDEASQDWEQRAAAVRNRLEKNQ